MNNSANTNLFTVGKTGDIVATGSVSGTNLLTAGSQGLQIKNGVSTNASINQAGAISCTSLSINSLLIRPYKEIVALSQTAATGNITGGGGAVGGWSYSYTGSGGHIKISISISCYVATAPLIKSWYIYKDSAQAASGTFYFNYANVHTAMPVLTFIDTTRSTTAATWTAQAQPSVHVDTNDKCTMTIAKF